MRSLLGKIFLSYWMAQALFLVLAIVITLLMRPAGELTSIESHEARIAAESAEIYENSGVEALRTYWRQIHDNLHVRTFLFDDSGRYLMGRQAPDWIDEAARGKRSTADTFWGRISAVQILHESTTLPNGHRYNLYIELPPQKHALFGPNGQPLLAIALGVLCSGVFCFALARHLTRPLAQLRAATQKMTSGDLSARTGVTGSGGDEVNQLLRDFDRMAERIEELVESQQRLLKDISHELRSPLARLNVALALARQKSGPQAESALDRMELEAERLNEMIGRLLMISRLESSQQPLDREPVALGDLVREIARDAAFEAQGRNCNVEYSIACECTVLADQSLLHSAIENVVRNAIRYTKDHTAVQIQLASRSTGPSGAALVQVTDCGPGVDEAELEKMFLPFYRLDDARWRGAGGAGLGLAITQRAIKLHGGSVRAANLPQGGLLVEIVLPLAGASAHQEAAPSAPEAVGTRSS